MKFVADENVDNSLVQRLRELGHDVLSASETLATAPDELILEHANRDQRILITSDKDFGELVYRNHSVHSGILLLRLAELKSRLGGRNSVRLHYSPSR